MSDRPSDEAMEAAKELMIDVAFEEQPRDELRDLVARALDAFAAKRVAESQRRMREMYKLMAEAGDP